MTPLAGKKLSLTSVAVVGTRNGVNTAPMAGTSHMPRPCVAIRISPPEVLAISKTATRGSPVPKGVQLAPLSVETYTPMSVPAYKLVEAAGSTRKALTGTCGSTLAPVPGRGVQVGPAMLFRSLVRQTLTTPNADSVTYAVLTLLGSITARAMKLFGTTLPVSRLVSVDDPVVVPNKPPLFCPTILTLSFCGETPMALIAAPEVIGS